MTKRNPECLIWTETTNTGALIVIPPGTSVLAYGRVQRDFVEKFGKPTDWSNESAAIFYRYPHQEHGGVYWDQELVSSAGSSFMLYRMPNTTPDQVANAVNYIRSKDDVVRIHWLKVDTLVDYTPNWRTQK